MKYLLLLAPLLFLSSTAHAATWTDTAVNIKGFRLNITCVAMRGEMPNCSLFEARAEHAIFSNANLSGLGARGATFTHAGFFNTNLRNAELYRCDLLYASFDEAILFGIKMDNQVKIYSAALCVLG